MSSVLVVGSVALDNIKTPKEEHKNLLGGSASYASVAAGFFAPAKMVGVVGEDFPKEYVELFRSKNVDVEGLKTEAGKTFAWHGEYELNMNNRRTLSVELNVFETFQPELPASYRSTPYVLLANIAPSLQSHVLSQIESPRFIIADTMDLWIQIANEDLRKLIKQVDMLILNDSEARDFTGQDNVIRAGHEILKMGPRYVVIKKGEHGAILFGQEGYFLAPAFPLDDVKDPTGAGDCFAGGLIGTLAAENRHDFDTLKKAVIHGTVVASFNVEAFSMGKLKAINSEQIAGRTGKMREYASF
ncbi:PfkB family carbohydrate kinase [Kamptonema cortianum]|nr:PfkB family carbohydrate kinase [Oscillatoria laete-virens]MDK3156681.1 PfkB family carbohydrate kinase [Kamptonema cortianum]MDL5050311.1 PfkB family carbohydrate kinase [Oscillatoria amoena NRMC-F 0135]MDL5055143.1 PfkB family carbohydrate kinase [Oscillatoria laete-virens NRMC-F 0139]